MTVPPEPPERPELLINTAISHLYELRALLKGSKSQKRESWLNGWPRMGSSVLIGTGVHCAGCGKLFGLATVAIPEDWIPPDRDPDWPFNEADCPLHSQWKNPDPTINPNRLDPNRLPK